MNISLSVLSVARQGPLQSGEAAETDSTGDGQRHGRARERHCVGQRRPEDQYLVASEDTMTDGLHTLSLL